MGDINFSIDTGLVEALKRELKLSLFIETGTFEGDAIEIARPYFDEIHSIELSPEYYELAKARFAGDPHVHLYLGDSASQLATLKPIFNGRPTLFWLDAHWCVATSTGGEKSQCPLLREIRGIGELGATSAIMIDDARLFASPPPYPHEISQWPKLDEVVDALRSVGRGEHQLKIFNDVIVFAPKAAHDALTQYMARNTVTLLKIKDKADGYDILDAQLKEKQQEIAALKATAVKMDVEIVELKQAAEDRNQEMTSIKAELEAECASKDTEIEEKDVEIASLKLIATERTTEMESIKAELEAECAAKTKEIEEKDVEIASLKQIANEREQAIFVLDRHVKNFQAIVAELNAAIGAKDADLHRLRGVESQLSAEIGQQQAKLAALDEAFRAQAQALRDAQDRFAALERKLAALHPDAARWADIFNDKDVHIRNLEALRDAQEKDVAESRRIAAERSGALAAMAGSLAHLEIAKYYNRQLADKEAVIQNLKQACDERESVIRELGIGSAAAKFWRGARALGELKVRRPFGEWLFDRVVNRHWMQIGILRQYAPRPITWDRLPKASLPVHALPPVAIVTPSYNQESFIESTLLSVLNQNYPKLKYIVQDGASTDASPAIIRRYADRLHHFESAKDKGQGDAIAKGFAHVDDLPPEAIMGWLNSDDLLAPRALRLVAEYFARHPDVDVVYGHRIIIDGDDREVARWIMPPHDPKTLEWIDYVPQETLFWRKRVWDRAGGIDPSFQFALDWDLLMRFTTANARIVRLPYFLGCFRVHAHQKTSQQIMSVGEDEMTRIRTRLHPQGVDYSLIEKYGRKARFWGAIYSRLHSARIRL